MNISLTERTNEKKVKTYYTFEWGKCKGERKATGLFTYTRPKDAIQKHHNDQVKKLLQVKKAELLLEMQASGSAFAPTLKAKENFLSFYYDFVEKNRKSNKRHLDASFKQFVKFINKQRLFASDVTEELCLAFRSFLLTRLTGDSPANYFSSFKRVCKAEKKAGYFKENPTEDISCKTNPSKRLRDNLEVDDYLALCNTPYHQNEIREAFIFCCYTGLRHAMSKASVGVKLVTTH